MPALTMSNASKLLFILALIAGAVAAYFYFTTLYDKPAATDDQKNTVYYILYAMAGLLGSSIALMIVDRYRQ